MIFWRRRRTRARQTLAAGLLVLLPMTASLAQAPATPGPTTPPVVPVSAVHVMRKDIPKLLRGLGTVQALQSVQVRSRVDGTLQRLAVAEGQDVKAGDLLAVIDPRPYQALLDVATAKKRQDEAQLAAAKADLSRYTALAAREVASQQKLENTQAQVGQTMALIAADQAQIDAAKLNLAFCYITAPFDGRVGLRMIDSGNFIRAAEIAPLFALSQIRPIAVTFTVPQDNVPAIQRAMARGNPVAMAYTADDKSELDRGAVLTIDNSIDAATGTIKVKASFPNDTYQLWPGQFVNARLILGTEMAALVVPSAAVRHGQDELFVYTVKPDQTVARQIVSVSSDDGVMAIVSKGLQEGQQVVTDGHSRLQNGSRVSIIGGSPKQAANPPPPGG